MARSGRLHDLYAWTRVDSARLSQVASPWSQWLVDVASVLGEDLDAEDGRGGESAISGMGISCVIGDEPSTVVIFRGGVVDGSVD